VLDWTEINRLLEAVPRPSHAPLLRCERDDDSTRISYTCTADVMPFLCLRMGFLATLRSRHSKLVRLCTAAMCSANASMG
jgi:hypothetical protein